MQAIHQIRPFLEVHGRFAKNLTRELRRPTRYPDEIFATELTQ